MLLQVAKAFKVRTIFLRAFDVHHAAYTTRKVPLGWVDAPWPTGATVGPMHAERHVINA